jgi:signal transduction histidine kinase
VLGTGYEPVPMSRFFHWPRPTVRLRLSLWYAGMFLLAGVLLLSLNYVLLRQSFILGPRDIRQQVADRLGITPDLLEQLERLPGRPEVLVDGVPIGRVLAEMQEQITQQSLRQLAVRSVLALGLMALLSLGMGWLLAGRMLRPLHDITSTARRLSASTLTERIDLRGPPDELKELADTFDAMLGRLEGAFSAQRDFVANASHELRTPLAIIRTELDVTMNDPEASLDDLRESASAIREAVDRSDQLIDRLLVLARSGGSLARESVDLAVVATECTQRYAVEADAKQLGLELKLEASPTEGDPVLLERLVANLVENAIRHNDPGGWFRVETGASEVQAWVRVANSGPVIAPEDVERLFERFYRPDRSRSRETGGFGLGLPIVRAVAQAHGGTADARALPGGGLEVTVTLPVRSTAG